MGSTVTWKTQPKYDNMTYKNSNMTKAGWFEIDVTNTIRAIARDRPANYTLLIKSLSTSYSGQMFWSPSSPRPETRPQLVVEVSDTARKPIGLLGQPDMDHGKAKL